MSNRVLFVDDHKFVIRKLRPGLEKLGYQVVEGYNGQDAVDHYKKVKPDIVLLDLLMPVKDGLVALKEIIQFDPDARIVMMVNLGLDEEVVENIKILGLVEQGAKAVLVKPVSTELLHKKIIEIVG